MAAERLFFGARAAWRCADAVFRHALFTKILIYRKSKLRFEQSRLTKKPLAIARPICAASHSNLKSRKRGKKRSGSFLSIRFFTLRVHR
jgi:hypothetical protein